MRMKWHRTAACLLLSCLLLEGCGNVAVHEELSSREEEPTVIRIAWWGGEERHEITGQVLELYEQIHPDIVFETLPLTWGEYFDSLSLETAQGNMPDLIQMDYQYIITYSENGSLADLLPFVEDGTIRTEDMDESMLNCGMIGGRMSGIALGSAMIATVCNPDVFREADIPLPDVGWTWQDFSDDCRKIKERTGRYGAAMTPILDLNLFHYWVRQHGAELFTQDGSRLGYEDDSVYVEYVTLFKELMELEAVPDSDSWEAINARGAGKLPVVTGEGGMMQEWNNFPVRMSYANDHLYLVTPPLSDEEGRSGLWLKPSMFFSVAETSTVKKECAQFLDWFLNSEEANAVMKGERGVPVSRAVRDSLLESGTLTESQWEMFRFAEEAIALCGDTPGPEPAGIEGINEAFAQTANACFYNMSTAEESAAEFRRRVEEILGKYK